MTAVARVYRWEIAKLLAQKRTYLGLGAAIVVPIIFVVVLVLQTGGPNDVPLGRYIRDTGLAVFAVLLSTVTRNSAASVVGALMWALFMQLIGVLPGTESFRAYLLANQFEAWHGFLRVPADWVPVTRALWVCALYITLPLI